MRIAYLILRVSDYLEDNTTLRADRKGGSTGSLGRHVLEGSNPTPALLDHSAAPTTPLPIPWPPITRRRSSQGLEDLSPKAQEVIRTHTRDSTLGMARWVRRGPVFEDRSGSGRLHARGGRAGRVPHHRALLPGLTEGRGQARRR